MLRFIKYSVFIFFVLAVLAVAVTAGGLYYLVVKHPGPEIEEENIASILGRESPVFYRDGEEKLGVLFQGIHRQYLLYDSIPEYFVDAIVAAEDDQFFKHFGVDILGITRAMIVNFRAGRIVQGGSTLTQQTAKNLFKRESRSYKAKLKELLFALRLEYRYSKEKILEFYSNQFYVSGNGHGLGVAARYYFDKDPAELSLVECAFIAGSVQRPNYFNPFRKNNKANPDRTVERVKQRVGYVLGKMLKAGMINRDQYDSGRFSDIGFKQGKMTFTLNTAMNLVKEGLATETITEVLKAHGISNVSTSGIRIITTLDKELQKKTLRSLRSHLSRLDVRLRGYERETVQQEYDALEYEGDSDVYPGAFLFGTIADIHQDKEDGLRIKVQFDGDQPLGLLDDAGIDRMVTAMAKFRRKAWSQVESSDKKHLLKQLRLGDRVYVSVRSDDTSDQVMVELERFPLLEGAALVFQQGAIQAMAGGMTDRFFNRAIDAKRLMGSTFKPFLFGAALQLGWNAVDLLDNRRDVFVFMDRPYFPRPDHISHLEFVSMSWAGVKSENVAAVWLLYHLADYLTPPRIRELAARLDMAPRSSDGRTESYQLFRQRIRDKFGIAVTRNILEQAAFTNAIKALEADFLFDNRIEEYNQLKRLHFGLHFDQYAEVIKESLENKKLKSSERKELELRLELLRVNFLGLQPVYSASMIYKLYIESLAKAQNDFFDFLGQPVPSAPPGRVVIDKRGSYIFTLEEKLPDDWLVVSDAQLLDHLQSLDSSQTDVFWPRVELEAGVTVGAFVTVDKQLKREQEKLLAKQPYSLDVLGEIHDFRVMLGLQYLIQLGKQNGIESELQPVLSFSLGSNVISLAEAVRMYETLVTGTRFDPVVQTNTAVEAGGASPNQDGLAIIERIEDPNGEVLYTRELRRVEVFSQKDSTAVSNILQNTVAHGTGKYARDHVHMDSADPDRARELEALEISVPLLGKTGTANQFRNAAFMGYIPVLSVDNESLMTLAGGYAVGVYVGFDTNDPMVKGTTRISGAQGALPIWSDIAAGILTKERVGDRLDPVDLTFNGLPLRYPAIDQVFIPIDLKRGGRPLTLRGRRQQVTPADPTSLTFVQETTDGNFEPLRSFVPFWKNEGYLDKTLNQ